jgi:hypothetical protein
MATDGTEWGDRFAEILLPGEDLGEEDTSDRPTAAPAPSTPLPEIDWSKQPTEEERVQSTLELGRAGLLSMGQVMSQLGFTPTAEERDDRPRPPLTNVTGAYDINPVFWEGAQTDYPATETVELRVGQMPPGVIFEYHVIAAGRVIRALSRLVPGMEMFVKYRCGGCQNILEQTLPSWRVGALLAKGTSDEQVAKAMQRMVDAGCPVCQREYIGTAAAAAQFTENRPGTIEVRHRCALCAVEMGSTLSSDMTMDQGREIADRLVVCDACEDRVAPEVYNKYKGLL